MWVEKQIFKAESTLCLFFCLICAAAERSCKIQPVMCGRIIFHHWHFSSWSSVTSSLPVFCKSVKSAADVWVWVLWSCRGMFFTVFTFWVMPFMRCSMRDILNFWQTWHVHHFNAETTFSPTCHFKLPWRWRRCCRAWWTTTWWTANELVHQTITGPFPVKSCTLENANWRSYNNRWLISLYINSWQAARLRN